MLNLCLIAIACGTPPDNIGPGPTDFFGGSSGRVAAVLCSPTNANTYWIGAADGGVWRTTNGGTSWTVLTDGMPTTAIGALAMDPAVNTTIYAGTGESNYANHSRYGLGMYRSFDSGNTWTLLGGPTFAGRCFSRILVSPADHLTVYAATTATGGGPLRLGAKGHPLANGPRGVFRSRDQGATWTQLLSGVPSVDATDIEFAPGNPLTMYACIGAPYGDAGNGFYRSRDGGDTWTRLSGIPTDGGRASMAVCAATGRIYLALSTISTGIGVGGSSSGGANVYLVARSDNQGDTWTTLTTDNYFNGQGFYNNLVIAHPTDQNIVFLGGVTVRRSLNGGTSWTSHNTGHPDFHGGDVDASGRIVWGSDGGAWRTPSPSDMTATPLNTGLTTIQFYPGISSSPANNIVVLGGMQDNGSAIRDSGSSLQWRGVTGGDGGWTRIQKLDPTLMFTCSQGVGSLNRSTNGGASFASASATGLTGRHAFFPPYLLDPVTPNRMLYATEKVWLSTNNGNSFTALSADLTTGTPYAIRAMAMGTDDPHFVYVATSDSRVLSSSDGGVNFTLRLGDANGWPRTTRELLVDPTDARTVYLAGAQFGRPHVRRSTDAGATWVTLDGNLPDVPVNVLEIDNRYPRPRLYAGTDQGVWVSRNDGQNWNLYTSGLPGAPVVDILLEPTRQRMVIATMGRAAWFAPLYCPGDFNTDGAIDFFDYLDFVDAFSAGDMAADFNAEGTLDFFDYLDFVDAFSGGC